MTVHEAWAKVTLGEAATMQSGGTPPTSDRHMYGGEIPWVSISDMSRSGKYIHRTERTLSQLGLESSSAVVFPTGTVLFAMYASVGAVSIATVPVSSSQAILGISCGSRLLNEYLYYSLLFSKPRFASLVQTGTQANLSKQLMESFEGSLPSIEEQHAIVGLLHDVDELLSALDALIAKKRDIAVGVQQALLSGTKRLPGFTEPVASWSRRKLGDLVEITMGSTPARSVKTFWGAGHLWATISDLSGRTISTTAEQVTDSAAVRMRLVEAGTLMMSFKLSLGRLAFAGSDLYTNEAICHLRRPQVDSGFLYYALMNHDFEGAGQRAVMGATLNLESLKSIEIDIPDDVEVQVRIAEIMTDLDAEIDALVARRDKTALIKQGMMDELLTGRTRLV